MTAWLVRAGKHGEDEAEALDKGIAMIGWREAPDLSARKTYEEIKALHAELYPVVQEEE